MMKNGTIDAVKQVTTALKTSGIVEPLKYIRQSSRESDAGDFYAMLLGSFSEYHYFSRNFGAEEKRVTSILELDQLSDEKFWSALLAEDQPDEQQLVTLYQTHSRVKFALNNLPALITLMESKRGASLSALTIPVPEGQSVFAQTMMPLAGFNAVDTEQLAQALDAVGAIYRACCLLAKRTPEPIGVQNWRSQPVPMFSIMMDKDIRPAFDRVLKSVGTLITEYDQHGTDSVLSMLHQLPELDAVDRLQSQGGLDDSGVDTARRLLINGSTDYILAGCAPASVPLHQRNTMPALVLQLERELHEQQLEQQGVTSAVDVELDEGRVDLVSREQADYYDELLDRTKFDDDELDGVSTEIDSVEPLQQSMQVSTEDFEAELKNLAEKPKATKNLDVPGIEVGDQKGQASLAELAADIDRKAAQVITEEDVDVMDETVFLEEESQFFGVDVDVKETAPQPVAQSTQPAPPPKPLELTEADNQSFIAALDSLISDSKSKK